ncbi:hypothetical protein ACHAXA_006403 [Cyclostephanos tholiformis]|uniref:Uncharacterized protein n=1 Tax=Cyclostephanos tholiformis TaxID=382380 RepID=A0ABD3SE05_9STRA
MDMDDDANLPGHTASIVELWDEIAAIFSGLIGGGRYGLKIRVPHALVMTFLFGGERSFLQKAKVVAKLAAEHASNLAAFAGLYKLILVTLKVLSHRTNNRSNRDIYRGYFRRMGNSLLSFIGICII